VISHQAVGQIRVDLVRRHSRMPAMARDIRQLQPTLAESTFRALLESAPDAIVIVDERGSIVLTNGQVQRLFGYEPGELLGQAVDVLLPEALRERHRQHRHEYVGEPHTRPMGSGLDLVACRKDGSNFPVEVSLSPLQTENGLLITSVIRDVSERKQASDELERQVAMLEYQQRALTERLTVAEAAMLQAARLAAVGQLAAAIAHEINNPLYAARNCLYLLEQELSPRHGGQGESQYLVLAREQLARIAGIIERMRDFYRPERGELAPHSLNQLLEETLSLVGMNTRYAAIVVVFTPEPSLPAVVCNGDQLRQVFLNLVLNAVEAMAQGGTLAIRTTAGPTVAIVEIQDSGIGIPEDVRARLFEPFFTTKANGTGLGLSISGHIVTQHGGQIEVESTPGVGTTFRIVLPYQPG
jgi:PAS domain S-box-containing protein